MGCLRGDAKRTTRPSPRRHVLSAAEVLRGRGHAATVQQSQDAGRFVCNWCYYHSLLHSQLARQARGAPLHALFLHVPPTAAIPLDDQFAFLLELLEVIAQQLQPQQQEQVLGEVPGGAAAAAEGNGGGAARQQQLLRAANQQLRMQPGHRGHKGSGHLEDLAGELTGGAHDHRAHLAAGGGAGGRRHA